MSHRKTEPERLILMIFVLIFYLVWTHTSKAQRKGSYVPKIEGVDKNDETCN